MLWLCVGQAVRKPSTKALPSREAAMPDDDDHDDEKSIMSTWEPYEPLPNHDDMYPPARKSHLVMVSSCGKMEHLDPRQAKPVCQQQRVVVQVRR